jgi:uncharacterized membrane protein YdjX (TVP38/TMEM64 family)
MSAPNNRGARAESPKPKAEAAPAADKKEDDKKKGGLFTPKTAAIVAVIAIVLYVAKTQLKIDFKPMLEKSVNWVEAQGDTAVYWYCAFTLIGVVCLIPTTPMEIAGGFLFSANYGGPWGVLLFTGGTKLVANIISVLIARHLVRDWVMRTVVAKSELLTMVSNAVKEEPWKMAFLVRGSMVPLFVKNYGLGVMEIDYLPIACCSTIFTNFYAMQNIYMGSTLKNLEEVFAPKKGGAAPSDWMATAKSLAPIAFNVLLVIFLVKAIKGQMTKQKKQIEENLKAKQGKETQKTK